MFTRAFLRQEWAVLRTEVFHGRFYFSATLATANVVGSIGGGILTRSWILEISGFGDERLQMEK